MKIFSDILALTNVRRRRKKEEEDNGLGCGKYQLKIYIQYEEENEA